MGSSLSSANEKGDDAIQNPEFMLMHEIVEKKLWLGDINASVDRKSLDRENIRAIVRCIPTEHYFEKMYPPFEDLNVNICFFC